MAKKKENGNVNEAASVNGVNPEAEAAREKFQEKLKEHVRVSGNQRLFL